VFDLRQSFVDFCAATGIGLFTSTSAETVKTERIRAPLALMVAAEDRLPVVCFRADHTGETRALVEEIKADMEAPPHRRAPATAVPERQRGGTPRP
jgi:hypothetical protein